MACSPPVKRSFCSALLTPVCSRDHLFILITRTSVYSPQTARWIYCALALSYWATACSVCVCVCVCVCVFLCVWISCHPLTALTRDSGSLSRFPPSLLSVLYMKWSTFPLQLQLAVNIAGQKTRDTGGLLLLRPGWQAGVKRNPFFFNRQKLKSHLWAQLLSVNSSGSEMSLMWGSDSKEMITDISRSLYYNFWDIFRIKHLYQLDAHLFFFVLFFFMYWIQSHHLHYYAHHSSLSTCKPVVGLSSQIVTNYWWQYACTLFLMLNYLSYCTSQ